MRNLIILFFSLVLLASCTGKLTSYEFNEYKWNQNEPIEMKFNSDEAGTKDLFLEVRSVYGAPIESLSLNFSLTDPNGGIVDFSKELNFRKENLDCTGDFCDQKALILKGVKMKKGAYSLRITRYNMGLNLYGLMEFRLIQE